MKLILLLSICAGCLPKGDPAEVDRMLQTLKVVAKSLPPPGSALEERACTLDRLPKREAAQKKFTTLPIVDESQLNALVGATAADPDFHDWRFFESPIFFVTEDALAGGPLGPEEKSKLGREAKWFNTDPYLVVARSERKNLPKASGSNFTPGRYDGWLMVFDVHGTRLCQTHVTASNSEKVTTKAIRVGFFKMPIGEQEAVLEDLRQNLKATAEAAMRQATSGETGLSFPGITPR
jgi:hypothetical protein